MMPKPLADALAQAANVGQLFVATADAKGIPHLAIAERIALEGEDTVGVTGWFCPRTAENVDENARVSLVVWDERRDAGFQLIGEVTQVLDLAMLDGFIPDETETVPRVERKLVVRVNHILTFSHSHHSDLDLA
jgi:Pyridoxamine 5'-phosphate oxidase